MNKEPRIRLEVAANIEAIKDTAKGRRREDYFIASMADHENGFSEGFLAGAEYGYKEAIEQAKEWLKTHLEDDENYYKQEELCWIGRDEFLADFESAMNKLWEEKK